MEPISNVVKVHIPHYLETLPIPSSFGGWFKLGVRDWTSLVPFFAFIGGVSYVTYKVIKPNTVINPSIEKDKPKIVTTVDLEDLGDRTCYCRCWRSETFPYCDGSHGKHNKATGDNVGPLVVQRK